MKLTVSLNDDLVTQIDEYAKKHYCTRSSVLAQGSSQLIMQARFSDALVSLSNTMERIAESGVIDESAKAELAEFKALMKMFGSK